ncbi:hypothetical protein CCP3SC1AL1_3420001 [Gammaproteobacteria bacterium]
MKLIVEIIEPFHGRIFDPACGSGGMFLQSAAFVKRHHKSASDKLSLFGIEKSNETVKLENNTRRIAILEEMARRIYEEWFVHFRFPGHEGIRMVDSELGKIPEGWEVCSFTDLFDVRYGKKLPTKNLNSDGQYSVYGGVIGRYEDFVVSESTCLITSRGNGSGTVWRTIEKAFVTNNSFVVRAKGKFDRFSFGFVELFAKNIPIKSVLGGAAQPQLTLDGLASLRVFAYSTKLTNILDGIISPLFDYANKLHIKNTNLCTTRDFLLPKLISGEIDVSEFSELEEQQI